VSETYGEYDDIGIGRSTARDDRRGHGGSLSDETTDSEQTSWILPARRREDAA
jgi:hypothetical protein